MWSHWLVLWGELCPTSPKPPRRFGILGVQQVFRDNCLFVASEHPIPCPYGSYGLVAFDWNHLVSVLKLGWLPFVLAKALFLRWFIAMFGRWISHLYVCIYICDYMCVCEFLYLFIRIYIRYRGIQWYDVLTPTKEYPPNNKGLRANRNQPLLGVIFAWEWFGVVVYVLYLHLGNLNK
jgi:hypothetical protein